MLLGLRTDIDSCRFQLPSDVLLWRGSNSGFSCLQLCFNSVPRYRFQHAIRLLQAVLEFYKPVSSRAIHEHSEPCASSSLAALADVCVEIGVYWSSTCHAINFNCQFQLCRLILVVL